jgi:hypothetical protein
VPSTTSVDELLASDYTCHEVGHTPRGAAYNVPHMTDLGCAGYTADTGHDPNCATWPCHKS